VQGEEVQQTITAYVSNTYSGITVSPDRFLSKKNEVDNMLRNNSITSLETIHMSAGYPLACNMKQTFDQ
jgi:hypothetical protein